MVATSGISTRRLGRIREVLAGYIERGETAGAVVVTCRRGESYIDTIGHADIASGTPMLRDTIFRIASMTKPVTAVAAMILVEETKLRLDDPVDNWLPELANRKVLRSLEGPLDDTVPANRSITLRDLLTSRLGMGAIMAQPGKYPVQALIDELKVGPGPIPPDLTNDEWMANFGRLPLLHQPGERWMYHSGLDVAGVLIARVSGMSLGAFMKERIFDPLGMHSTGFGVAPNKVDRLATAYRRDADGRLSIFDPAKGGHFDHPPKFEAGGGGLVSTAQDYLRFAQLLLDMGRRGATQILSRPAVELLTMDHITPKQKELSPFVPGFWDNDGWGFGLSVTTHTDTIGPKVGSYGWTGGLGTSWRNDPKEEMITMFFNQRMMTSPMDVRASIDCTTLAYQAIED